mmetsp:Transcript_101367/g.302285  ORF Transcript_101367/g.302285 Transcript_101367/m.302285 type:complete len:238 (-) Transcript_101367:173-886(-)
MEPTTARGGLRRQRGRQPTRPRAEPEAGDRPRSEAERRGRDAPGGGAAAGGEVPRSCRRGGELRRAGRLGRGVRRRAAPPGAARPHARGLGETPRPAGARAAAERRAAPHGHRPRGAVLHRPVRVLRRPARRTLARRPGDLRLRGRPARAALPAPPGRRAPPRGRAGPADGPGGRHADVAGLRALQPRPPGVLRGRAAEGTPRAWHAPCSPLALGNASGPRPEGHGRLHRSSCSLRH